eukprot:TRINITY_DN4414_c0_g1_i3.p1 TRINITY_DN4414_c0_g1~~TRINITY_DN4414_c0_g1_i3.p1  ORF type:complete len:152 (-),score=33.36 TRINITY_DN4414_c0_g1_i3:66-470(-)
MTEQEIPLPPRTVPYRWKKVPDFEDPEFVANDPEAFQRAKFQRLREHAVKLEEMALLQKKMKDCYFRWTTNQSQNCKEIVNEYWKRLQFWNFDPDEQYKYRYDILAEVKEKALDSKDPYNDIYHIRINKPEESS